MSTPTRFFGGVQADYFIGASFGFGFGNVWYVDSVNGSNSNLGNSPTSPFATLAQAQTAASAGDTIIVAPASAFTLTAVLTLTKAGLSIIGLGNGTKKPTITVNAAADGLSLEAAGILIENFHFAAPGTDEATAMINIAAAGCTLRKISGIGSTTSKNFVDCFTLASGADDCTFEDVKVYNSVVAVNSFLSIEAAVARFRIRKFFAFGDVATAGIIDAATATHLDWEDVVVGVVGTTKPAATLDSNPTGLINRGRFAGTHATIATDAALGNAIRLFDVLVLEETDGSKQGAQIPAVDAD